MTPRARQWMEWLRKAACSLATVCLVVWWGQEGPLPRAGPLVPPLPPEASRVSTRPAGMISPFVIDGFPMAMETREVRVCDTSSWRPENTALWNDGCLLLDLDRSPEEAVATWVESGSTLHHAARLVCRRDGSGELTHIQTAAPIDTEAFEPRLAEQRLVGPETEGPGSVPVLEDSVRLLQFRNLDWTLYLDEPSQPSSAVDRLQAAMGHRGWQVKKIPPRAWQGNASTEGLLDGRVLVRGGDFCLVNRVLREEAQDLLLVACRGTL